MKISSLKKRLLVYENKLPLIVASLFCIISLILFTFACSSPGSTNFKEAAGNQSNNNQGSNDYSEVGIEEEKENELDNSLDKDATTKDNKQPEKEEELVSSDEELTTVVYYADEQVEYLVGETKVVSSGNKYVDALSELMKEPINSSLVRLVPDTTLINSVTVEDGLAKVDLSKNFVEDRFNSDVVDVLLIYSVVNTLTEFSEINFVTFYIDGEKLDILGMLDLKHPIPRKSDLIKKS